MKQVTITFIYKTREPEIINVDSIERSVDIGTFAYWHTAGGYAVTTRTADSDRTIMYPISVIYSIETMDLK